MKGVKTVYFHIARGGMDESSSGYARFRQRLWKDKRKSTKMSQAAETLATHEMGRMQGFHVHLLLPMAVISLFFSSEICFRLRRPFSGKEEKMSQAV